MGTPRRLPVIDAGGTPRRLRAAPISSSPVPHSPQNDVSASEDLVSEEPYDKFLRSLLDSTEKSNDRSLMDFITSEESGTDALDKFSEYIGHKFHLPYQSNRRLGNSETNHYRCKVKLKRFARFQQMYQKNKRNLADMILNDKEEAAIFPNETSIRNVYQTIYESVSPPDASPPSDSKQSDEVYYPIDLDEIKSYKRDLSKSSPGIDNFSSVHLLKVNDHLLQSIVNYQLMKQRQVSCWKENKTVLIPKTNEGLDNASNWRPITISSIFVRMTHKILADRISKAVTLNPRQKAFVPVDGCAENVNVLDNIIQYTRKHHKNLSLLGIDLAKAFDTISHHSIKRVLKRFRVNKGMINYIMSSYSGYTTINCGALKIPNVRLNRGVKQGDPLSPILFNLIMDELLDQLPPEIGTKLSETTFNSFAFADDLIILSETSPGMNNLIGKMEKFFTDRNLMINVKKCFSLVLTTTVKNRAPMVIKRSSYKLFGQPVKANSYGNCFKYLGINYDPNGKMSPNTGFIDNMLSRLRRAPLKPYQKLALLHGNLIPKVTYQLVLGRITKGLLLTIDTKIREFLRDVLDLPHDCPNSYFYAKVKCGGLGIMPLAEHVPCAILNRSTNFNESSDPLINTLFNLPRTQRLIAKCYKMLKLDSSVEPKSVKHHIEKRITEELWTTTDGCPLSEFKNNTLGQQWMFGNTNITGRSFRNLVKLRIGRLATKESCSRGRSEVDKKCRHCDRVNETQTHILQNCHFTHFQRMKRHDSVCTWVQDECLKQGKDVLWEQKMTISDNLKIKPDLIVKSASKLLIVDVSIVAKNQRMRSRNTSSLSHWYDEKVKKYETKEVKAKVSSIFGNLPVESHAIIISERGIWFRKNAITLDALEISRTKQNIPIIRSMEQSIRIYNLFMRATK